MKYKILLLALLLPAVLLGGCAQEQSQLSYIGADTAKSLALEAAGLAPADAQFTGTDMSSRDGLDYYLVGFTADGVTYAYAIDALTGAVLERQAIPASEDSPASSADGLPLDASGQTVSSSSQVPPPAQTAPSSSPSNTNASPDANTSAAGSDGLLSAEDAKAAALAHAGLTSGQVTFVKSKLEYEGRRQVYDVEFHTQDYREYDYEIDAYTGEIVSFDYDAEHYTPPSSGSGSAITAEDAEALALAQVPGASSSDIKKFETDYDDGRLEYEGKILYDGMEYEFEIDAYSGAFRSWEAEPIHD